MLECNLMTSHTASSDAQSRQISLCGILSVNWAIVSSIKSIMAHLSAADWGCSPSVSYLPMIPMIFLDATVVLSPTLKLFSYFLDFLYKPRTTFSASSSWAKLKSVRYLLSSLCLSSRFLKVLSVGLFTTVSGRLFQGLTTLWLKECCLGCSFLHLLEYNFKLWPLILSLHHHKYWTFSRLRSWLLCFFYR